MKKENKITCAVFLAIPCIIFIWLFLSHQSKYYYFDKGTFYTNGSALTKDFIEINDLSSKENAHKVLDELWDMKEQLEKK